MARILDQEGLSRMYLPLLAMGGGLTGSDDGRKTIPNNTAVDSMCPRNRPGAIA